MKNWKTTLSGLFGALGVLFPFIGLPLELGNALSVVGMAALGYFAKDKDITGVTK